MKLINNKIEIKLKQIKSKIDIEIE